MKIRNGFVSNSSTSSFSLYGVQIPDNKDLYEMVFKKKPYNFVKIEGCSHKIDRDQFKFCPECGLATWKTKKRYEDNDPQLTLEEYFEKLDLRYFSYDTDDGPSEFVGINLKGNGGKREANKNPQRLVEIQQKLKEIFPKLECDFYSGEYAC